VKLIDLDLPITTTARNVDFEFYWDKKCKSLKNCKKEDHGNSFKQAFIERRIQNLLENHKDEASVPELKKELEAARYEVFCLKVGRLVSHLDMSIVFQFLPNLSHLTLTYGAKHVGMEYERPLFGMKMSDAKIFSDCMKISQSLVYLSLPGNLIDDDLIGILIKGMVLNKTISILDLSHNKISNSGARKIAKFLLSTQILTQLNLSDNQIAYEGSRYLAQALKVNKVLKNLNLKLNRLDDKAGSKLCIDLLNNSSNLDCLNLSSNALGHMFCESLAEFLKLNRSIQKLDISCNFIDDSNAATLKDSLEGNPNIIEIDVRNNNLTEETEEEINEIITKNYLASKKIPYKKLGEYAGAPEGQPEEAASPGGKSPEKAEDGSPTKVNGE
jgi:Ran GTPase-activating protein (RanGAP) involved in mRNA processing and transport